MKKHYYLKKSIISLCRKLFEKINFRIILWIILFFTASVLIYKGYYNYRKLSIKKIDYPVGQFYITASNDIDVKSLKLLFLHTRTRSSEKLTVYLDIDVLGQFEYISIQLPWKIKPGYVHKEDLYSIDSTGGILIIGDGSKDRFLKNFVFEVEPDFEKRFSEISFDFPVSSDFSDGMPYSNSREFIRKIIEPKISYMEVNFSSYKHKAIESSYPKPDAVVDMAELKEYRWWFNPDEKKFISSINITFEDKDLKNKENEIAFNSGVYLSIGFSILLSLILELIKLRKNDSQ